MFFKPIHEICNKIELHPAHCALAYLAAIVSVTAMIYAGGLILYALKG